MATERKSARELIENGLRDTERLISQKQYTLAMSKARQTLEYITRSLCRKNGLPEGDLITMIDDLFRKGVISRESCTHYHKIRMLGDAAIQTRDNNAYNANTAYQLLSQEVFAYRSAYAQKGRKGSSSSARSARSSSARRRGGFEPFDILKFLIPILAVILIVSVVRLVKSDKKAVTEAPSSTAAESVAEAGETEAAAPEEPETEAPQPVVTRIYTTTVNLNVRTAPSKDAGILVSLPAGTQVDYVEAHDDQWAVINYNGGQAYVASEYLSVEERTE